MSVATPSLDELIEAHESSAMDPDATHSRQQVGLLLHSAIRGAAIGLVHAGGHGPTEFSVDAEWLRSAQG